jgi:hypothetical protein
MASLELEFGVKCTFKFKIAHDDMNEVHKH